MVNINFKKEILFLSFRLLIIILSLFGIFAPTQNSFFGQFWFFTLQSNLFVVVIMTILAVSQILKFFNVKLKFIYHKWFNFVRIATTFFITITGFVYCFLLAPVAIITNSPLVAQVSYRDIFLHVLVPILVIIEYYMLSQKLNLKFYHAFLFLIYPIAYVFIIFLRAKISKTTFPGGSQYPYFFIDPTFNSQGWPPVFLSITLCLIAFFLLGLLYIYINNKLTKNDS